MNQITILGGGLSANLAAAYFRKRLPHLNVVVLGKNDEKRPIVGESTIEYTVRFMYEIGLGPLLEEKHSPKHGLTYYHKENIDDPSCKKYYLSESPSCLRMPSFNLNRHTFDRDLEAHNRNLGGISFVDANIVDVDLGMKGMPHRIHYTTADGMKHSVETRYLIDATGMRGMIGKKLGIRKKLNEQRSCFWFRLEDFDANLLGDLQLTKKENHCFDSYNATHHFLGRGNWMWCIPMRTDRPRSMISVGITYRPDIYPHAKHITNMKQFLEAVDKEHPTVANFVRSGKVVDTNVYSQYIYKSDKYYDASGWFLLGDAGRSFDPLFSNGIMFTCMQSTQIAAMIAKAEEGMLTDDYAMSLETIYKMTGAASQDTITNLYHFMHKPVQAAWTLFAGTARWYNVVLPMFANGFQTDPDTAKGMMRSMEKSMAKMKKMGKVHLEGTMEPHPSNFNPLYELANHVAMREGATPEVMRNRFDEAINWNLRGGEDVPPPLLVSNFLRRVVKFRLDLLRHAEPKVAVQNLGIAAKEAAQAVLLGALGTVQRKMKKSNSLPFRFADITQRYEPIADYWPEWADANVLWDPAAAQMNTKAMPMGEMAAGMAEE